MVSAFSGPGLLSGDGAFSKAGVFSDSALLGAARGFNPVAALGSDLIAYVDVNRPDLITAAANAVSSLRDIKAGYDFTQGTGAAQPIYAPTGFNGSPVISADGVDDNLTCTDPALLAALPSGASPGEIWVLCSQDAPTSDAATRHVVDYGNGGSVSRRIRRTVTSSVNRASVQTGSTIAANTAVDFSSRHVIRAQITPTNTITTVDGGAPVSVAVVPATSVSRARLFAGSASAATNPWHGGIVACLWTLPLSADKASGLAAFLTARRG